MNLEQIVLPMVGPSVSIDNQMMRFDGTTGHRVKAAPLTHLTDTGHMALGQIEAPETQFEMTGPVPLITLHCDTETDAAGARLSGFWFSGEDTDGNESHLGAIKCFHDGSDKNQKGAIAWYTNDGTDGDAPTERMRITSDGNVGIGTPAPSDDLHIKNTNTSVRIEKGRTDTRGLLEFQTGVTRKWVLGTVDSSDFAGSAGDEFYIGNAHTDSKFWIEQNGNVGINVTDPDAKLEILATTMQLKLSYDATNYSAFTVGAAGDLTLTTVDADAALGHIVLMPDGNVGIHEQSPETLLELTDGSPFITLHCDAESDGDGARKSGIWYTGEQSTGQETHLAGVFVAHDGSNNDQKGYWAVSTNSGTDDDAPTERMRIDSAGLMTHVGATKFQNATDSTTAYQWMDADGGTPILNIDTTNERVGIGIAAPQETLHVVGSRIEIENTGASAAVYKMTNSEGSFGFITDAGRWEIYDYNEAAYRASIDSAGDFGIGSRLPLMRLTVAENGVTPESSVIGVGIHPRMISIQGDGAAYFMGRDVTNNIEFIMGTSNVGVSFVGSMTDHPLVFRAGNNAGAGNVEYARIAKGGNFGIGVTDPDAKLEIFGTTMQQKWSYDATNYAAVTVGAAGDLTVTTVDASAALGHINLNPDGNVGINEAAPDSKVEIASSAAALTALHLKEAVSQTADIFTVTDSSDNNLAKITAGGKIQSTVGFRAVSKEFGDAFVSWRYGGDTPEHSGQTGSYDHTGGAYGRLFTATAGVFTQTDEDNHNWIVISSGTYKGAKAEIQTYIDTTNVIVRGMGWDSDISSSTFSIVPHPLFIVGDGCNIACCVGNEGNFHLHSQGFTGLEDLGCISEIHADFGADGKEAMCIDVFTNGYNLIDGLHINNSIGDLQPGDTSHCMHIVIDETEAINADATTDIDGLTFETTDTSAATKHAMHVGVGFDVALLVSGASAIDPDYGYQVTSGVVIDRVNSAGAGDDAFINAAVDQQLWINDNDYILIGDDDQFEVIQHLYAIVASQDCIFNFYYSKAGGGWTQFYPSDTTTGGTKSGANSFTAPGDWTKDDEAEVNGDITDAYYVKILRTRNFIVTPPTEDFFKIYASIADGMQIRGDGTIKPASLADADVSNESIYYSTTQSKLCYKDSVGGVNALY